MGIGAAMLGSSALGMLGSIGSSWFGANAQMSAEQRAMAEIEHMFNVGKGELDPFISAGQSSEKQLMQLLGIGQNSIGSKFGSLTKPFSPADLSSTPGYQFALKQGLEATQNSFAGQGLGASGNAMRGGVNYAEGLASTTFQQQFQDYLMQNQQIANMLLGPTEIGAGAAGQLAGLAGNAGGQIGQSMVGMGNAQAGAWGATGGAINNMGQNISQMMLMSKLFGGGGGGGLFGNSATSPYASQGMDEYSQLMQGENYDGFYGMEG